MAPQHYFQMPACYCYYVDGLAKDIFHVSEAEKFMSALLARNCFGNSRDSSSSHESKLCCSLR